MSCAWYDRGAAELFFYGELDAAERERFAAHLENCAACRAALADLEVISQALAAHRAAAAPPVESWEPFMRRLDTQLDRDVAVRLGRGRRVGSALRIAATLAIAAVGLWAGFAWQRASSERAAPLATTVGSAGEKAGPSVPTLVSATDEHFERSKLVLLGLAAKDARHAGPNDWQYERRLAATLLADTTQYRLAAAEHGRADLAGVLGDLETVLLEASLGDESDPRALVRLQRLIDKRDLLTKIQVVTTGEAASVSR
jgi:hypothetical protein